MRVKSFVLGSSIAFFLWVIMPVLLIRWNTQWGLPVYVSVVSRMAGVVIFSLGLLVTLYLVSQHLKTGRVTPVAVEKPIKFIAAGAYKYSRNPMYLAILTTFLGGFLIFGHLLLLVYVLLGVPVLHLFVVYREEPELKQAFGKAYEDYLKKVPRWF